MSEPFVVRSDRVSYSTAARVLAAGMAKATELGMSVSLCVTDPFGGIVAAGRMDGTTMSTVDAARGKAYAAGRSGRSTQEFLETRLMQNEALWRALSEEPDTFLVPGGFPLMFEGRSVGGVGVSGGKFQDDVKVGEAMVAQFEDLSAGGNQTDGPR